MANFFTQYLLPWLGIFLSIYLIYYAFKYQFSKKPLEDQLYKAYLPMFLLLEPILYKNIQDIEMNELRKVSEELNSIVNNHYELISPSIVHWSRLLKRGIENKRSSEFLQEIFSDLCRYIDIEFERTRRKMFLPTRNIYYRLNNNQYRYKPKMYIDFILTLIPPLLGFLIFSFLLLSFMSLISRFL